jgi:hypothetical protein
MSNPRLPCVGPFGFGWPAIQPIQYEDITLENLPLFCYQHFAADYSGSSK